MLANNVTPYALNSAPTQRVMGERAKPVKKAPVSYSGQGGRRRLGRTRVRNSFSTSPSVDLRIASMSNRNTVSSILRCRCLYVVMVPLNSVEGEGGRKKVSSYCG